MDEIGCVRRSRFGSLTLEKAMLGTCRRESEWLIMTLALSPTTSSCAPGASILSTTASIVASLLPLCMELSVLCVVAFLPLPCHLFVGLCGEARVRGCARLGSEEMCISERRDIPDVYGIRPAVIEEHCTPESATVL